MEKVRNNKDSAKKIFMEICLANNQITRLQKKGWTFGVFLGQSLCSHSASTQEFWRTKLEIGSISLLETGNYYISFFKTRKEAISVLRYRNGLFLGFKTRN